MISHHLGVLRRDDRDARWVYYRLNPETTAAAVEQLVGLLDLTPYDDPPARCD